MAIPPPQPPTPAQTASGTRERGRRQRQPCRRQTRRAGTTDTPQVVAWAGALTPLPQPPAPPPPRRRPPAAPRETASAAARVREDFPLRQGVPAGDRDHLATSAAARD